MKSRLFFSGAVLCISIVLSAQRPARIPIVNVEKPTVVAFFPSVPTAGSEDADANEALSDFQFYAERLKGTLGELGIRFSEQYGNSFRIRVSSNTIVFTPKAGNPGYYLIAPGRKPQIEYGVMTDSDLLPIAKKYFGISGGIHP